MAEKGQLKVSCYFKPQSKKGNFNLINSNSKTLIILILYFHQFLIVATFLASSNFILPFLLVRINKDDKNNDDVNISTDQSEDIIPVEFQEDKSEEITEKIQLRKKESSASHGIK